MMLQDYFMVSFATTIGLRLLPVDLNWPTNDLITSLTLL